MINVFSYHTETGYGRDAGYSVNGARRTTLGYDGATGRIATFNEGGTFTWGYLPGSHLKSSLTYPNGLTAAWSYEPARDLLTQVVNAQPDGTVISAYTYTNDLLGRRTSKNDEQYGYNVRDELISADEVSYAYDDIGNRTSAEGKSYTANNLNQYTAIDDFVPQYDLDGNQTTVKTATGIWQVEYNAENRPIRWTQGTKVITMAFDRLGRRVSYREMNGATQIAHTVFLYNGYLCIQQLFSNSPWNIYKEFIWDPTEPIATRPLCFRQNGQQATFLLHDGNKNVTDVVTVGPANTPVAHYDYAPFGAATGTRASDNPFRFSSEYHDDALGLVYYNYRHYSPEDGRWLGRDLLHITNIYRMLGNNTLNRRDILGMYDERVHYYFVRGLFLQIGYDEKTANEIAFASAYVDTNAWNPLAEYLLPSEETLRNRRLLHNLGDLSSVQMGKYRACILCLAKKVDDPQTLGVLLHALGDTYAHRSKNGDGYGEFWGHAWDGTDPDDVRNEEFHGKGRFLAFGYTLYANFRKTNNPPIAFFSTLYAKDCNGKYLLPDDAIDKHFQVYANTTNHYDSETVPQNTELDRKIETLLPNLECCYEKARRE